MTQVALVPRGRSRFRVLVQLISGGLRPYVWEIYDVEDDRRVSTSPDRFRTSAEAWQAGMAFLNSNEVISTGERESPV